MDPATVTTQTFAVHAFQTGLLTQTYEVISGTIALTPIQPFHPGELVQASATTATLSLGDGTGPASPTVWRFRTAVAGSTGEFADSGQSLGDAVSRAAALGDLDGDGDLDAFVANDGPNRAWRNDGDASFTVAQSMGNSDSVAVALGDLDGDGDLDAFVANFNAPGAQANLVWLNDGGAQGGAPGTFNDSGQRLGDSDSVAVSLGDLDGDADLDAYVANYNYPAGQPDEVLLNDGTGTFSDSGQSLGAEYSRGLAIGDLDGDGDLDAFVTIANGQPNRVWLNDGSGTFSDSGQLLGAGTSVAVALGDLDGDGDLDAFVANVGANKVWLNDGTGTFTDSGQNLGSSTSFGVALGDLEGDGDLDAMVANLSAGQANTIWLSDGAATFVDSGKNLGDTASFGVSLGDLDGDGDLDPFFANDGANKVWLNLPYRVCLPFIVK
jgi:hypothetical protein